MSFEEVRRRRDEILALAARNGVTSVAVFGSAARGEAGPESDLDLLVEFEDGRSLLDLSRFWQDVEELLQSHVDIVERDGLHWYIRERVLSEAVPL